MADARRNENAAKDQALFAKIDEDAQKAEQLFQADATLREIATHMRSGRVSWVLTQTGDEDGTESAAGVCSASRLPEILQPYSTEVWFDQ